MNDSVEKIVTTYFSCLNNETFEYKGKVYVPKPLSISPLLMSRKLVCLKGCGACCNKYTMDYLPFEDLPDIELVERQIVLNRKSYPVLTYFQKGERRCDLVDITNGLCRIHDRNAMSCDFELIRLLRFESPDRPNILTQKTYGRAWNMTRIDGKKGALCSFEESDTESRSGVIRRLERLLTWFYYFEVDSKIPDIIRQIKVQVVQTKIGA